MLFHDIFDRGIMKMTKKLSKIAHLVDVICYAFFIVLYNNSDGPVSILPENCSLAFELKRVKVSSKKKYANGNDYYSWKTCYYIAKSLLLAPTFSSRTKERN